MAPQTHPRPRRRRSSCPKFLWILILVWAVMMMGRNVTRLVLLPDFIQNFLARPPIQGPTYYDILGVSPMVSDTTLRRLRKQYNVENHPDKTGGDPESIRKFLTAQEAFDTLSDGRQRCEYDADHGIRGKWRAQSCHDAFSEEYMQIAREKYKRYWEIKDARNKKTAKIRKGKPESSPSKNDPERNIKPPMPKTEEPASRKPEPEPSRFKSRHEWPPSPEPEARMSVPVATVEVEDETTDAVDVLTSGVARIFEFCAKHWADATANISAKWEHITSYFGWIGRIRLARDYEYHE